MDCHGLKYLREQKGLSQVQLADKSGVSVRTIRDLENGRNTSPGNETIELLCAALCPDNKDEFWSVIKTGDEPDFSVERNVLSSIYDQLPPGMNYPMSDLLNPSKKDGVMSLIAAMTGYLQNCTSQAVKNNVSPLLDAFAAVIQTATLTTHARDRETFTHDLICRLEALSASDDLPAQYMEAAKSIIAELQHSRLKNDPTARINAIRSAYFFVYDHWPIIEKSGLAYIILSDISILCEHSEDTPEMRRHVFYAAYDHFRAAILAKQLNSERWW